MEVESLDGGDMDGRQERTFETAEARAESHPLPNLRRRRSSGRVHFSEEHLAQLRADSIRDKAERQAAAALEAEQKGQLTWGIAFFALALARYFSAKSNLIHDCDEVFNYWEPLHYLLYKSGFQTWEYSSEFALRSWLYILLHAVILKPVSWWYGTGSGKVEVFYFLRFLLGLLSASSEAAVVAGAAAVYGKRMGSYTLMLLCFTSGLYTASTSFLPSTFSMCAISLTAAALLYQKPTIAVAVAAVGVLLGWPFSVLAVVPLVLYAVVIGGLIPVFLAGLGTSSLILVISAGVDRIFYGRWTSSVFNLVLYNALGGGDSAIFGVEGPLFYLRNGFNNFNLALPLALLFPVVLLTDRRKYASLLTLLSPMYLWMGFMSIQAHKEERFLYPVYPLICLGAAGMIEALPDLVPRPRFSAPDSKESVAVKVAKVLRPITLALILGLSYGRTASLLYGYSAPLQVYRQLPDLKGRQLPADGASVVCVGADWYRFPSSFFLPKPPYEVAWLNDGEKGLLPLPFSATLGGSAAAPPYFNNRNRASPQQFVKDDSICEFLVELKTKRPERTFRGDDSSTWKLLWEDYFLDNELSPPLPRAIFIPWLWQQKNTFATYRLLKRINITGNSVPS